LIQSRSRARTTLCRESPRRRPPCGRPIHAASISGWA
jgi:hypothetical protein